MSMDRFNPFCRTRGASRLTALFTRLHATVLVLAMLLSPGLHATPKTTKTIPLLPPLTDARELPWQADVGAAKTTLFITPGKLASANTLAPGIHVYVMSPMSAGASPSWLRVLTPAGQYGWARSTALKKPVPTPASTLPLLQKALRDPASQNALSPEQNNLLQATFAYWLENTLYVGPTVAKEYDTEASEDWDDSARNQRVDKRILHLAQKRKLGMILPVLLSHWAIRSVYDEYSEEPDFTELPAVLTNDGRRLSIALCNFFAPGDNASFFIMSRFRGNDEDSVMSSDYFFSSFINRTIGDQRPADCLVSAYEKIAGYRTNIAYDAVGESVFDRLQHWLTPAETTQYLSHLATSARQPGGSNFALALLMLDKKQAISRTALLMRVVTQSDGDDENWRQFHSMRALSETPITPQRQAFALECLSNNSSVAVRQEALHMLGEDKPNAPMRAFLQKQLREHSIMDGHEEARLWQMLAEIALNDDWRPQLAGDLESLAQDNDPYVRHLYLMSLRKDALAAMKTSASAQAAQNVRGRYLEVMRGKIQAGNNFAPQLSVKPTPVWMLRPQSRLTLRLQGDAGDAEFKEADFHVQMGTGQFVTDPAQGTASGRIPHPDTQPLQPVTLDLHPGRYLVSREEEAGKVNVVLSLWPDEILVDGMPAIARNEATVFTIRLQTPTGPRSDWAPFVWLHASWLYEPDDSFF